MSRRDQIKMSDDEVAAFLAEQRTVICATNGPDGFPHLMPLWYVVRDGEIWAWTYGVSQKIKNLDRDPRATVQVEAGEEYQELRGVMIRADVEVVRDVDVITELGLEIFGRYTPDSVGELAPQVREMIAKQATKRVGMRFIARSIAPWDPRKLAGVY